MTTNVTVAYQARQQVGRLSPQEQADLTHIFDDPNAAEQTTVTDASGRFVSRLGADMRVYWTRQDDGSVAVLSIVRRSSHDA